MNYQKLIDSKTKISKRSNRLEVNFEVVKVLDVLYEKLNKNLFDGKLTTQTTAKTSIIWDYKVGSE